MEVFRSTPFKPLPHRHPPPSYMEQFNGPYSHHRLEYLRAPHPAAIMIRFYGFNRDPVIREGRLSPPPPNFETCLRVLDARDPPVLALVRGFLPHLVRALLTRFVCPSENLETS